jgi:hypothetical protein
MTPLPILVDPGILIDRMVRVDAVGLVAEM